ncbi:Bcr/CflA family efflux MFS transporter [Aeromicrobium senzhongii]|uniref:Bcr/CflA family efflux MFS transporter n=1 Tax=Aeromicrobium senzhongii TaxID=2663859 RepID=A0ABX6SY19_9ACTN|nr:Bcr/CflA family efflux MFS transporter [Aeromicrobium senzhongii]MTB87646.1 Bcr/CflA family efflux MFS transporter [Aeromicrobium senzhongii]QNL95319.1 Bcr/CflA family efflux MFS transporter [Aeromicrobium senzhongii]
MTSTTSVRAPARPAVTLPTPRLALFALIAAASPLAIDLYLASFPAIEEDLRTSPAMVQLTLTAYIAGVAIGQPIWGPLSDRFGRHRPLVISNALTLAASVAVVLSPTIETLIGARFVQALAASAGMVVVRAMISDLTEGLEGVRALALMMTVHAVVPVVAPVLGGVLSTVLPWRGVLSVFAGFVALQLVASVLLVRETLPHHRRARRLSYLDLARVMRRGRFVLHATTVGLTVGAVMSFIAASSFVYQDVLGLSPLAYGASFGLNACGMVGAGLVSARLARSGVQPVRTMSVGFVGALSAGVAMVVVAASPMPVLLVGPVMVQVFFLNLVMSNGMGLAMAQTQGLTGAGSAMLGFWMFAISALVTPISGWLAGSRPEVAMAAVMAVLTAAAAAVFASGLRLAR